MGQRVELHDTLVNILMNTPGIDVGADHVYFQPPTKTVMKYPCIRYQRETIDILHANDLPYKKKKRYQVMVIDPNPDSAIPDAIAQLPLCRHERFYTAENLNHDVYTIFF